MEFPNIYHNKHYKLYAIIPIALLLFSLYFIPKIQLDQSLRGGISIQIETNSSVSVSQLTSAINSRISGAEAVVSRSPGSITITISANQSLTQAHAILTNLYALNDSYSSQALLVGQYTSALSRGPNATVQSLMNSAQANETAILNQMKTSANQELQLLSPFTANQPYSVGSSSTSVINAAANAYNYSSAQYKSQVISVLKQNINFTVYSFQEVTATLGAFFLNQLQSIILMSFVIVAIAVFFVFRNPIPSLTVVFGSASDIAVALGVMGLLGIPLGVASVGGLLMLIGYSIDTDVLAAIRVLKRGEGTPQVRAHDAMRTGMTLTVAAIITFSILLIISYLVYIPTYFEISSVVLAGLVADLAATWLLNTPLLLWYRERKDRTVHGAT